LRTFKRWADKASPGNLMAYLFGKDRLAQSLRLGFAGAWHYKYARLSHQLMSLQESCPYLIGSFMSPNETDLPCYTKQKLRSVEQVPSGPSHSTDNTNLSVFGQSNLFAPTLHSLRIDIPSGYIQNHSQRIFANKLKQIYRDNLNLELSDNLYVTRLVANVQIKHRYVSMSFSSSAVSNGFCTNKTYSQSETLTYRVGQFFFYKDLNTIVRILQCFTHCLTKEEYVFLVVQIFRIIPDHTDHVLQLPLFQSTDEWCLILPSFLHSHNLKPLFMVDASSTTGVSSQSYPCTLLYCPWTVDYL
jgi:hypothetical protein